jgi:hypothetical protein
MSIHEHHDNGPSDTPNRQSQRRDTGPERSGFWQSRSTLALGGFLLIAAFFLFSEHRAHALGILPFLLILACPLLHLFMHGGHGGHGSHGGHDRDTQQPTSPDKGAEP